MNFDTHRFIKRLEKTGMPLEQAEELIDIVSEMREEATEKLATKADMLSLSAATRKDIDATRKDIIALSEATRKDIAVLSEATRRDIEATRKDMELLESRIINKVGVMMIGLGFFTVSSFAGCLVFVIQHLKP